MVIIFINIIFILCAWLIYEEEYLINDIILLYLLQRNPV